jgi:Domain of unknown function (DUF5134)
MAGPSWLAAPLAAVMIATALYSAGRLAASRLWRRPTEVDADTVHVVMGVAMAGMFLPSLSPLPGRAWEAIFAVAAAWFGWQTILGLRGSGAGAAAGPRPGGWRCPHPMPHLVESAAMIYVFAVASGPQAAGARGPMAMPSSPGGFPALAVVLALFMVGYVLWTADQLTFLARARAVPAGAGPAAAGRPVLAPGLAACSKIAMGLVMGYMLLAML